MNNSPDRYASCLSCGHFISMAENSQMICNVNCPKCGWTGGLVGRGAFGPAVFADDYEGKSLREAIAFKAEKDKQRLARSA